MDFEKRNQRIRELYDQCSTRELSELFKISRQRIHKIVNPHGEESERRKINAVASLSPSDLEKLFELEPRLQQIFKDYKAGLPKNEIIAKHQLKSSYNYKEFISRWRNLGVPFLYDNIPPKLYNKEDVIKAGLKYIDHKKAKLEGSRKIAIRNKSIFEAYFSGENIAEIAAVHQINITSVTQIACLFNRKHNLGLKREHEKKLPKKTSNPNVREAKIKTRELLYQKYIAGENLSLLSREFGLKLSSVYPAVKYHWSKYKSEDTLPSILRKRSLLT